MHSKHFSRTVAILFVIAALFAAGGCSFSGNNNDPVASDEPSPTATPPAYRYVAEICSEVDWTIVAGLYDVSEDLVNANYSEGLGEQYADCMADLGSDGFVQLLVRWSEKEEDAKVGLERLLTMFDGCGADVTAEHDIWESAHAFYDVAERANAQWEQRGCFIGQDANLAISVNILHRTDVDPDEPDAADRFTSIMTALAETVISVSS